jgi:DNA primase
LGQANGYAAVRDLVARREPLVAFAIRSILSDYNLETVEGRVQALRAAAPLVMKIKDPAMRPQYGRKLAGDLGMELEEVIAEIRRFGDPRGGNGAGQRPNGRPAAAAQGIPRPNAADPKYVVEREVLKLALQAPSVAGPMFDGVDASAYVHPCYAAIRGAIATVGGAQASMGGASWIDSIRQAVTDDTPRAVISELAVESLRTSGEPSRRYAHELVSRLSELVLDRDVAALKSKLQRINPVENPDAHTKLFGELVALEQARRSLREQAMGDGEL